MRSNFGRLVKRSSFLLLTLTFVGWAGAGAQTTSIGSTHKRTAAKIDLLQRQLNATQNQLEALKEKFDNLEKERVTQAKPVPPLVIFPFSSVNSAPTQPVPTYWTVPNSNTPSDIPCAPKLALYQPGDKWKPIPDSSAPPPSDLFDPSVDPSITQNFDTKLERPPIHAYISQPASLEQNLGEDLNPRKENYYCNPLNRWTRLFLENAALGANWGYTNVAGSGNVAANVPIVQTAGTTYQLGIGYSQKPILKQLRAALRQFGDKPDPDAFSEEGTLEEDLVYNAITMSAGFSYGKTLTAKTGSPVIETLNSRPSYSATLTYSLPLETIWSHIMHPDARVVGPGYYFRAPCAGFWTGNQCLNAPGAVNTITGIKASTE